MRKTIAILFGILSVCVACSQPAPPPLFVTTVHDAMSTQISVVLPAQHTIHSTLVVETFEHVSNTANEWREGAVLALVNRQAGVGPVTLSPELFGLVERGIQIGEMSSGAFDITWAAMWGTWDFVTPKPPPDAVELVGRVALVDYRKVRMDVAQRTVFLPAEGMKLGLGGIAKGYALDQSAQRLKSAGVANFSLTAGGQVYAEGLKGDRKWRFGIRDPRGQPDDFFAIVEVSGQSVSTSGDYERFFIFEGQRYHHILNPRTGQPARGLRSVTIISDDAALADALSTAVMVMGREAGLAMVERLDNAEAILVDDKAQIYTTTKAAYTLVHPPIK